MKFLPGWTKRSSPGNRRSGPDGRFGTGLWRHNRDRFIRAVDRYYTTAVAIHESLESSTPEAADLGAADTIIDGTERLNELSETVDTLTAQLHSRHPLDGQVVPALTRQILGDAPELLTKASSKVAEAVLAASMARAEIIAGRPIASSAEACRLFIEDAADCLDRVRARLGPDDSTMTGGPS